MNRSKATRTPKDQNISWEFSVGTLEGGQQNLLNVTTGFQNLELTVTGLGHISFEFHGYKENTGPFFLNCSSFLSELFTW